MRVFTYIPDECVDLGLAGEHPIEFTGFIDEKAKAGDRNARVTITRALVAVTFGDQTQELDVTKKITEDTYAYEMWKDEIRQFCEAVKAREWDEPA